MISGRADNTPQLSIKAINKLLPPRQGCELRLSGSINAKAVFKGNQLVIRDTSIPLLTTPCHFGGSRYWLGCPSCQKRVGVIYHVDTRWGCRTCHNLKYSTQYESPMASNLMQADKIHKRMNWVGGPLNGQGDKPKGMHWKTYFKLVYQHQQRLEKAINSIEID